MSSSKISEEDLNSFTEHLQNSSRILALCGAGLSASSGLPTFRGAGGLWRNHEAVSLATPEAFAADPALVWQFYSYRRHMALQAKPNPAHFALAEMARRRAGFVTLSQNVDGLSQRAEHPLDQLHLLHGSLFDVRCTSFYCDYSEQNNFEDPIVPSLALPTKASQPKPFNTDKSGAEATTSSHAATRNEQKELDISIATVPIADISTEDLPHCPKCRQGLLRPGVVWFGEMLPEKTITAVEEFIDSAKKIDLMLVIGTSAKVFPAAGYVDEARSKGARVAVINMERSGQGLAPGDWFFEGDAGIILPKILESIIGDIANLAEG